ncbi:MAG: glycoside hydrolase N-terminal domain-containing protein [Clostridia bacterium]|nr:glycoside hydrolase N-terminal domain-containing protein [Clostridia bacterium]
MNAIYNRNRNKIERWDEAIPLGNGALGGLLFGDKDVARLSLDSSSLWDLRRNENTLRDDFTFDEFLALVMAGEEKNTELQERFGKFFNYSTYPTKIPCAEIDFKLPNDKDTTYTFSLGEATGRVLLSGGEKIEVFFDAVSFIGYARYPLGVEVILTPPDYKSEAKRESLTVNCLCGLGYPLGEVRYDEKNIIYRQPMTDGQEYSVYIEKRSCADCCEAVFTVKSPLDNRSASEILSELSSALERGFDSAHKEHTAWWESYLSKTAVSLPKCDTAISELYEMAHYLIGAGSRAGYQPMPLQGVWTGSEVGMLPPWKGDYHFDLNVQGTYNWAYRAGRIEAVRPLIEYFIRNFECMSKNAEKFFGMEGAYFIPGTADLCGNVMGGWVQYTYSIGSALWMLLVLDKWYDYTNDKDFLEGFLIPAMRGSYKVLTERFLKDEGGVYNITLSVSPEINDDKHTAWLKNSTYDVTIIREFLRTYIKRFDSVGEPLADAEDVLCRLTKESVDEGGYMLAEEMPLPASHRHMSHCMDIFPFSRLDYLNEDDLVLMKRTLRTLEQKGTKMWIGFAFVWVAALYAAMADGNGAISLLRTFANALVSENGFHLNGDYKRTGISAFTYRPFTLEGNGMLAEAVQEMLMQYHHDVLRFFPAIPDEWREGASFRGFMLDSYLTVSARIADERVCCTIENRGSEREIQILFSDGVRRVTLKPGKTELTIE